jgi:hypothetical protein
MALVFTAEATLQGQALLSVGARACRAGRDLGNETRSGRRDAVKDSHPDGRW